MPLLPGVWAVNVNGMRGELSLDTPSPQGDVTGTLLGQRIDGFWNESSQRITFSVMQDNLPVGVLPPVRVYQGYLFSTPPLSPPGQDVLWTLAGVVTAGVSRVNLAAVNDGITPTTRRHEFGWFAQITQVM